MKLQHAKAQLMRIGRLYPTFMGMLTKKTGDETYGHAWATQLMTAKGSIVEEVIDELCEGRRELVPDGEPQDRVWYYILQEAKAREAKEWEAFQQYENYQKPLRAPWREPSPGGRWCRAIKMILSGPPLPDDQVKDLQVWQRSKTSPLPDWVTDEQRDVLNGRSANSENNAGAT